MKGRQEQVEAAFHTVESFSSPDDQARYLAGLGAQDPELRAEVEALLRAGSAAEVLFPKGDPAADLPEFDEQADAHLRRYQLLEKIGEGGMGIVYRAEQLEPVRREVAIKIVKLGMDTRQFIARFEAERQALALMDHPNIAKVLDGGAIHPTQFDASSFKSEIASGRPYFAMELVRGWPITEFCERNTLSTEERLRLFIPVCQAVQHAHQKGVIHRDLKPSNVMVTVHDGAPVPKVIDFGVAKAMTQKLTEKTLVTQHAAMIGTPAYMSPEQAASGPDSSGDIDTRSDIYSLGVLLYELLAGSQPFPEQRLRSVPPSEMQRIIAHEEPDRPSTRLIQTRSRDGAKGSPIAPLLFHRIDRDLDWIVMRCLEKDRTRRYETANGLGADLLRFLQSEPVVARPPSRSYRFRKLVLRNRLAFMAASVVALALILGIVVSSWQALRARRAERRAERRLQTTVQLMSAMFTNIDALCHTIGATRSRDDLAKTATALASELLQDAGRNPATRRLLGQLYMFKAYGQVDYAGSTTGEYKEGLDAAKRALGFLHPSESEPASDDQIHDLASAEMFAGLGAQGSLQFDEALAHYERMGHWATLLTRSATQRFVDRGHEKQVWVRWLKGETLLLMGRTEEVLTNHFLPVLAESRSRMTHDNYGEAAQLLDMRDGLDGVARCLLRLGRRQEAADCLREALPLAEALSAREPSHSLFASMLGLSRGRLGEALLGLDQPAEALPLLESAIRWVSTLQHRDPANPGFVQLEVVILQSHAAGYVAWAGDSSAPEAERLGRLQLAGQYLVQAEERIRSLRSPSLQTFLRHELDRTWSDLRNGQAHLGSFPPLPRRP